MKQRSAQIKDLFCQNWLFWLIVAQPVLDVIAYWNQNAVATAAGYIRLAVMVALPAVLLFKLKKKRAFVLSMGVIGLYSLLHILNGLRVGSISLVFDAAYLAKVIQMPVLAVCFVFCIRDEEMRRQAEGGLLTAAGLTLFFLALACLTGTENSTYGEGYGISGWVIDSNRCANSILFVTLSTFAVYAAVRSEKWIWNLLIPAVVTFVLILNGTKACYLGLLAILAGFVLFMLLEGPILKRKLRKLPILTLAALFVIAVLVYPISPRAKEDALLAQNDSKQGEIKAAVAALGYDLDAMTLEEKLNTPPVREVFEDYYDRYMGWTIPDLFDRFGYEAVLRYFDMSTDVGRLIDTRQIKLCYSNLVWQQGDGLTKLLGFEVTNLGTDGLRDLENDWPALFYYYGYLGLALYVGFVLFFLVLVVKRLIEDFKGSFTLFNFALLLCLLLQIGLAQFSGAILRRPNVSIYMAVVLALIWYQTAGTPVRKERRL